MSTAYVTATSNTGVCTLTAPAGPNTTWNLTDLEVSMSGPTVGPNAKLNIYDGPIGGTLLKTVYLGGPNQAGIPSGGSVGWTQQINIPKTSQGLPALQSLPGNAMNIQVVGTGQNLVTINARLTDGLG